MTTITFKDLDGGTNDTLARLSARELDIINLAMLSKIKIYHKWIDEAKDNSSKRYWRERLHEADELLQQLTQLRQMKHIEELEELSWMTK